MSRNQRFEAGFNKAQVGAARLKQGKTTLMSLLIIGYRSERKPEGRFNEDLKYAITSKYPVRMKPTLRAAAVEHMPTLEQTPERIKKYFGESEIVYAAS